MLFFTVLFLLLILVKFLRKIRKIVDKLTFQLLILHPCSIGVRDDYKSRLLGKPTMWFPNRSDTDQAVQSQKQVRSMKFQI